MEQIRPDTKELAMMIGIALHTAEAYALRNVFNPRGKFDREIAVETLTDRVVKALGQYDITRPPTAAEAMNAAGYRTLPLFPELPRSKAE